ncbi:PGF-pre-PGF domain-containing protein [Candidatus Woesearchaeota archaeon]|nr:PGF-pre-PGF domain-containing protein [Candidatus Woesearchaeota archaeon]
MRKLYLLFLFFLVTLFVSEVVSAEPILLQGAVPNYFNRTVNTIINITMNTTAALNTTSIKIILPFDWTFVTGSNGTSSGISFFSNVSVQGQMVLNWTNRTSAALIENTTLQSFWFNITATAAGDVAFTILSNDTLLRGNVTTVSLTDNFVFSGYVKNETGGNVTDVNISMYQVVQGAFGPPASILVARTNSGPDGNFTFSSINGSAQLYQFKLYQYNSTGSAVRIGSLLPPFPAFTFYPFSFPGGFDFEFMKPPTLNGTTFYLQPAATLQLYAKNSTAVQRFGYEVIDQGLGFPIESSIMTTVSTVNVVVPIGRNYTVMFSRFFTNTSDFLLDPTICNGDFMNNSDCPAPPLSNSTLGNFNQGQTVVVNQSLTFTNYRLSGCINIQQNHNNTALNITKVSPKLIPWSGFVPPVKGDMGDINLTHDINYTDTACPFASYNISVIGSTSGITYLIEAYAKNASTEAINPGDTPNLLAAIQNVTITGPRTLNLTLSRLTGIYWGEGGDVNTSRYQINIQNSSGGAVTTNLHVDVKVKNPTFGTLHYIIESLSNGTFYVPILNNSNFAKVLIFANDAPPREVSLNLSKSQLNITLISMKDGKGAGFKHINSSGQVEMINSTLLNSTLPVQMRFLRNSDACNILPPPTSCEITSMTATNFNPFKALVAGKINLEMKITSTNTTLMFMNFDMFSAKQPPMDSVIDNAPRSASSSTQSWQFGSFAPANSYDYAIIGMPYSDDKGSSTYLEDGLSFSVTLPILYDENWNVIWNSSRGDTSASLTADFIDYNSSSLYRAYLNDGATCDKNDNLLTTTPCFINTTTNVVWMRIPHFSGLGPSVGGSSTSSSTSSSSSGGGGASATSTITTQSVTLMSLHKGESFSYSPPNLPAGVQTLSFVALQDLSFPKLTVASVPSSKLPSSPTQPVFNSFQIKTENFLGTDVHQIAFTFLVDSSWIASQHAQRGDVILLRYVDGSWTELPAYFLKQEGASFVYQANSPGFSYFAIALKSPAAPLASTIQLPSSLEQSPPATVPPAAGKKSSRRWIFVSVVLLVFAVVVFFSHRGKKVLPPSGSHRSYAKV